MNENSSRPLGPHPGWVAAVALTLNVAAVAAPPLLTGHPGFINPLDSAADTSALARERADGLRIAGFLLAGAGVPVTVCAATWTARLRAHGLRVPGPYIGLGGGVLAAGALTASGLVAWALGAAAPQLGAETTRAMAWLAFLSGGVGFALPLGLLVSGVAVPGLLARQMPRPLAWAGLALALACELTWFSLLATPLTALLPVARFGSLAWLVAAGFLARRQQT